MVDFVEGFLEIKGNGVLLVSSFLFFRCFIYTSQKLHLTGSAASEATLLWTEDVVLL